MTLMVTLVVQRPRGQRPEVFHDKRFERLANGPEYHRYGDVTVYSYEVLPGNVLKIYGHAAFRNSNGTWYEETEVDQDRRKFEVAHFRPNQWDSVRSES